MLTDYIVEHAKPGPKAIRLSDSRGLYLAVLPNGSQLWRLDFRFDGRGSRPRSGRTPTSASRSRASPTPAPER